MSAPGAARAVWRLPPASGFFRPVRQSIINSQQNTIVVADLRAVSWTSTRPGHHHLACARRLNLTLSPLLGTASSGVKPHSPSCASSLKSLPLPDTSFFLASSPTTNPAQCHPSCARPLSGPEVPVCAVAKARLSVSTRMGAHPARTAPKECTTAICLRRQWPTTTDRAQRVTQTPIVLLARLYRLPAPAELLK